MLNQVSSLTKEIEFVRADLALAKSSTASVAASSAAAVSVADGTRLGELQAALDGRAREVAEANERCGGLRVLP